MGSTCCNQPTTYDPDIVGRTVGDLWLRGWDHCAACGKYTLSEQGRPCDAPTWTIAKGGRSVDIGNGRVRFGALKVETGERLDVVGLMARIAQLPELEREVERLRNVIRTGGAMYRLERARMGIAGGHDPEQHAPTPAASGEQTL